MRITNDFPVKIEGKLLAEFSGASFPQSPKRSDIEICIIHFASENSNESIILFIYNPFETREEQKLISNSWMVIASAVLYL